VSRLTASIPSQIDVINVSGCPNRVYTYTISTNPSNATSLVWSVPAGATFVSGQGTTSITVSYPPTTIDGVVYIQALNNCSLSGARSSRVKLGACASGISANNNPQTKVMPLSARGMKVQVYPNPTTSTFNLQVITTDSKAINARILDVQGRFIKSIIVAPYQTATIGSELKAGVYMVEVKQGNEVMTVRVVKY
jgi:hypothetical protein